MPAAANVSAQRRGAWLEIDLDALRDNVSVIRELLGPGVAVAPVVKADAYGHGVETVAPLLASVSDALCVATLDEALALRAIGIDGRIITLYPVGRWGIEAALEADIELTVMSESAMHDTLRIAAMRPGGRARLHLAIETGMARGGVPEDDVLAVARAIGQASSAQLVGVWTHLANAGEQAASANQVARFARALEVMGDAGVTVPARHVAASEGIFAGSAPAFEMVRPGLAVYGVLDDGLDIVESARPAAARLRPAMAIKARAAAFSDVPSGGGVGYGGLWQATRPSRVAILPVGYGDGYARSVQPAADVLVRGRRVPVVGAVSMDSIAVDVTAIPGIDQADEFVLMGVQGDASISANDLARWRNTIVWEVLCGMAGRLGRVYNRSAGATTGLSSGSALRTTQVIG